MNKFILLAVVALFSISAQASTAGPCGEATCLSAPVDAKDIQSLQKGASLFVSYCLGCHSVKYIRYDRMAEDLKIDPKLVQEYLNFTSEKPGDQMFTGVSAKDQAKWFGAAPPDLTLETRLRSPDWVYTYLLSFYPDEKRPYGVNNKVFKDVAMPHVLEDMQKTLKPAEFRRNVGDIVNFLAYTGDPNKLSRHHTGIFVLLFLVLLMIPVWLLNKEYWKDIK